MQLPRLFLATSATLLALAAPAAANILPTQTLTLPVKVPALGGWIAGTSVMTVTSTDSDETATVPAPSIILGTGQYFRVDTCLKRHVLYGQYESKCNEAIRD